MLNLKTHYQRECEIAQRDRRRSRLIAIGIMIGSSSILTLYGIARWVFK